MFTIKKLQPHERLLVEAGVEHRVVGPGMVWLWFWQKPVVVFSVGVRSATFQFSDVRTIESIPVELSVQVSYQVDPTCLTPELMPQLPEFQAGGWSTAVKVQTEHVLRQMFADYPWSELGRQAMQLQLEQELVYILTNRLQSIALRVNATQLIKTSLPANLQRTLIKAQQDHVEAGGRARVLKDYFTTFGGQMSEAMPHILRWEAMNLLHKTGKSHLVLSDSTLADQHALPELEKLESGLQGGAPALADNNHNGSGYESDDTTAE